MDLIEYADSHCHLNYDGLSDRTEEILSKMKDYNVNQALNVCTTLEESKNVLDLHEEETIVQKAHNNHASRRRHQRSKKRKVESNENGIATPTAHFNRSQIAKLKARVQQLGYKSQKKV